MAPFFSIIIPMYNRERFIDRAIQSCLRQSYTDFEIVVVDDASTDNSIRVVENILDRRILLIKHDKNQERLIARNNGAKASSGQWIVWFDSDDELLPNALSNMKHKIDTLAPDIKGLRFMCRLDSGQISPDPPFADTIWDYNAYLLWLEGHHEKWSESVPVVHRDTIDNVLFPEDTVYTGETHYHLNLLEKYKVKACSDIVRLYHLDAENNTWNPNWERLFNAAPAFADRLETVISLHGHNLKKMAPSVYKKIYSGMITQFLLAGQRKKAWRKFQKELAADHFVSQMSAIMALGLVHPHLLALVKTWRSKKISKKQKTVVPVIEIT